MGIEALNNAARAAGFAMVPPDDAPVEERAPEVAPEQAWRPSTAVAVRPAQPVTARTSQVTDWFKGVLGVSGRGAPAGAR